MRKRTFVAATLKQQMTEADRCDCLLRKNKQLIFILNVLLISLYYTL